MSMAFMCLEAAEEGVGSCSSLSVSEPESEPSGLTEPGVSSPSFSGLETGELINDSPSPFSEPEPPCRASGEEIPGPESLSVHTDFPTFCWVADPGSWPFGKNSYFWMLESVTHNKLFN